MSAQYEYDYEGKRPSKAQIIKRVQEAVKAGAVDINLNWGENWLRFEYVKGWAGGRCWHGFGWFKSVGGDDIAKQLNEGKL